MPSEVSYTFFVEGVLYLIGCTPGLAETLRQELLLYSIDVHIYFPVTIFTPGYEEENKIKPALTLKIEESDGGITPESCAASLLQGMKVEFTVSENWIDTRIRCSKWRLPHRGYVD